MACLTYKKANLLRLVNILLFLTQISTMYRVLGILLLGIATQAQAQYFYNDILANKQAKENFLLLKTNEIKRVTVTSTDPDGMPTEGFAILQQINSKKNEMVTSTQSTISPVSIFSSSFTPTGNLLASQDSTENAVSQTTYSYGENDNLQKVTSQTHEPEKSVIKFSENRLYSFDGSRPTSMIRIKNRKDTLKVEFIAEEHGLVGEERWIEKGKTIETYYYYYDANGRLTDIAHFNKTARRILPDYIFEYDTKGRITSMDAIVTGTNQYRNWRYSYDARGLKIKEIIYNKDKRAEGKVLYNYE